MKRKILAQGDRDGACFLYSIANSHMALTKKQVTQKKWEESIAAIPFRVDDFLSGNGTLRLDDNVVYLEELCRDFLEKIQPDQFKITSKNANSDNSLRGLITHQQVAIVAINEGLHWVSVVDADETYFHIACSAAALELGGEYTELKSDKFQRAYNLKLLFEDLKLWGNYALLIRRISAA